MSNRGASKIETEDAMFYGVECTNPKCDFGSWAASFELITASVNVHEDQTGHRCSKVWEATPESCPFNYETPLDRYCSRYAHLGTSA